MKIREGLHNRYEASDTALTGQIQTPLLPSTIIIFPTPLMYHVRVGLVFSLIFATCHLRWLKTLDCGTY